ncbi:arylesterase [Cognatishimia sp. 1_MG-2023]|uniref:arylesterase n=1 Tax=Cognatishimia sp. 1_MG-2023 TaxID=3062642 RepID=UPI00387E7547
MSTIKLYGALKHTGKAIALVLTMSTAAYAEEITLVAMGDSLTQGYGLAQGTGFVPQLETWLRDNGAEVRVMNAGVSGDTTAGGLSRVAWTLTPDIDAMIVALGGNDMLRGVDPAASKSNLAGILDVAQAQNVEVMLIGMQAPGNFGPDYKAQFDGMYPDLAAQYATGLVPSFLAGLGSLDPSEVQSLMQADGIHPNAEGVARIVDDIGPQVLNWLQENQKG